MKFIFRPFFAFALILSALVKTNAAGWPTNYEGVMLQGFSWDNYTDTKWTVLEANADEYSIYFDLIWVPNSGYCGGHNNMGYMPIYWFTNHNSSFGTETQLRSMIKTFKDKGTGIIADVVINHRNGKSNWYDFPVETWNGQTWQIGLDGICGNDEMAWASGQPKPTGKDDTGQNFDGARDLDHTNTNVQNNCKNYCKFLLEDLGYTGFRFDMVKGYGGEYLKKYIEYSNPAFSVGEYWDGSYDALAWWIESTGKTSAAFDFACKFLINDAFHSGDLSKLVWKANGTTPQPCGLIHYGYTQYAVTFVDNHDTYHENTKFNGNIPAANAFILSSPGTPCVFLEHYKNYKSEIQALIKARKKAGIHNNSPVRVLRTDNSCYMAEVTGSKGKLAVKIGSAMISPEGYSDSEIATYGTDYCVWVKSNTSSHTSPANLYVMGNLAKGNWQTNGGIKMTKSGNSFSAKNVKLAATGTETSAYFSFASAQGANWDIVNASDRYGSAYEKQPARVGENAVTVYTGNQSASNCASWSIAPGFYNLTVDFDTMTLTISVGEDSGDDDNGDDNGDNDNGDITLYWDNATSDWATPHVHYWGGSESSWPGVAMTKVGGNLWKYECPAGTTGCLFNAGDGDNTKTGDFSAYNNHVYSASGDRGALFPEKLYVLGNLSTGNWTTDSGVELTKEGDYYVADRVQLVLPSGNSTHAYFSLASTLGSDWDSVNKLHRFGPATADQLIAPGNTATMNIYTANHTASSCNAWKIDPGTYTIKAHLPKMELTVMHATTQIEEIGVECSTDAPIYYNLQGVRVINPGPGLYIKIQSGHATKIRL